MNKHTMHLAFKVMGSLANRPGDTLLACTDGVTPAANQLCMLTAMGAAEDHASLYLLPKEESGRLYISHVQGAHNVFAGGARRYATRAVYECSLDDSDLTGGYTPIIGSLDGMRHYDRQEYGASDIRQIETPPSNELAPDEKTIYSCIAHCLARGGAMAVKIGDDDRLKADDLRKSGRLAALLHAIDHLPPSWRHRASLSFAVEHGCTGAVALLQHVAVIAHFDDVRAWEADASFSLSMDWTGAHPCLNGAGEMPSFEDAEQIVTTTTPPVDEPGEQATGRPSRGCTLWPAFIITATAAIIIAIII